MKPMSLPSKWGLSAVVLRVLSIPVLRGCRSVFVVTSQGVGCNEDLLLVKDVPLVSKGQCMRESAEFRGSECHSDTCLCRNNRGQGLVKHAGEDLVP